MKRYCEYRRNKETCMFVLVDEVMERQCEDLKLYYDSLGYERIKALGYKELNLKNEMMNRRETYHLYFIRSSGLSFLLEQECLLI